MFTRTRPAPKAATMFVPVAEIATCNAAMWSRFPDNCFIDLQLSRAIRARGRLTMSPSSHAAATVWLSTRHLDARFNGSTERREDQLVQTRPFATATAGA